MQSIILIKLESFLDSLKAKNGFVRVVIILILVGVYYLGQYLQSPGNVTGIVIPDQYIVPLNWALGIIGAATGTHTTTKAKVSALKDTVNP